MIEFEKMTVDYVDPKRLKVFDYSRKLFPELKGEAYDFLKEDIRENGIRTPLEITENYLILCGHERHRIALELKLQQVPVIFYPKSEVADQKIRCIKDNLARKAVDVRTKVRCYGELRELYGLKRGELGQKQDRDGKGQFNPNQSGEGFGNGFMTHADMAKEVGFSEATMERALKIENSELPEEIKDATFKGKMGIETVANLLKETQEVQQKVVPKILNELETEKEHIFVQNIVDAEKDKLQEFQINSLDKALEAYEKALLKMQPHRHNETNQEFLEKATEKAILGLIRKHGLVCPSCGKNLKELV